MVPRYFCVWMSRRWMGPGSCRTHPARGGADDFRWIRPVCGIGRETSGIPVLRPSYRAGSPIMIRCSRVLCCSTIGCPVPALVLQPQSIIS
jgi:hypothetical protein